MEIAIAKLVRQARVGYCFEDPKHPRLIAGGARREAVGGMSEAKVLKAIPRAPQHKQTIDNTKH
jgi:hypothetical protein